MTLPQQLLFGGMGPAASLFNLPPYREGVAYTKRVPNCQKCGQHGRKSRLKGHKRVCPFKDCNCPKCQVVSERQKLMADQIKIRRRQRKDTLMNLTREKITATLNAAAAVAAVPVPGFSSLSAFYNAAAAANANGAQSMFDGKSADTSSPTFSSANNPLAHLNLAQFGFAGGAPLFQHAGLHQQQPHHGGSLESGRASSPMSINSLATTASSSACSSAPAAQRPTMSPATTATSPSVAGTDQSSPPQSAGLAAPIPLNPLGGADSQSPSILESQQLLQLLLLCQQQQHQQQPQHSPLAPGLQLTADAAPASVLDIQDQLQQLLALSALGGSAAGLPGTLGLGVGEELGLEDMKKFAAEEAMADVKAEELAEDVDVNVV